MNKKSFLSLACAALVSVTAGAQEFDKYFEDATMRLDYVFAGNATEQHIYLEDVKRQERWAGRKARLAEKFLNGNGQITVQDAESKDTIYVWTFSTLFQEWMNEPEAKVTDRAFESCYNIPYPKNKIDVTVTLTNNHNVVTARMKHTVDPKDILIRKIGDNGIPFHYVWKGNPDGKQTAANPEGFYNRSWKPTPYDEMKDVDLTGCIDLAILAEGYTEAEMGKFYSDCERAVDALFTWEPFKSLRNKFNVVAVAAPSRQSGPSVPLNDIWVNTAVGAHYSTFYSDRYLTTQNMRQVYDLLAGVPFEHVMVLVNTDTYGGGGIYNQVTLATSDHHTFKQVFVHEFGHEYAGLADEYAYSGGGDDWYPADTEPWEPNITTLKDFSKKWADLMPKKQPVPTPLDPKVPNYRTMDYSDAKQVAALNKATQVVGVFEGAGYMEKGCYRPAQECRMKINEVENFCPVCDRAIRRITEFYTSK